MKFKYFVQKIAKMFSTAQCQTSGAAMPCIYVNHGGGPLPLLGAQPAVADFLGSYASTINRPRAILLVTAHWIADTVTVSSGATHPLLFDYGGFPPQTYKYRYDAPGSPELAESVCKLLAAGNIPCKKDPKRGWDHGTFVPLMLMYPDADIPVVALSLQTSLDPEFHIRVGEALQPLRDDGTNLNQ
jgi:4,5-DOPA dioxygenase extradiol